MQEAIIAAEEKKKGEEATSKLDALEDSVEEFENKKDQAKKEAHEETITPEIR